MCWCNCCKCLCCCRCCCTKCMRIVCSIIWIAIALALVVCIIIIAVAWGGSKISQNLVSSLVNCNPNTDSECDKTFGKYVSEISGEGNYKLECSGIDTDPKAFSETIEFVPNSDNNLGVYVRMSNKGIDNKKENIVTLTGNIVEPTEASDRTVYLRIPVNDLDENNEKIADKKKQYIVHDKYMHVKINGSCGDANCPDTEDNYYTIKVNQADMAFRMSFKTVPDFINIKFDGQFNYEQFTNVLYKIIKPFNKSTAEKVKSSMQSLKIRVKEVTGENAKYCPVSPEYEKD